jgi:hypothetical protein
MQESDKRSAQDVTRSARNRNYWCTFVANLSDWGKDFAQSLGSNSGSASASGGGSSRETD